MTTMDRDSFAVVLRVAVLVLVVLVVVVIRQRRATKRMLGAFKLALFFFLQRG